MRDSLERVSQIFALETSDLHCIIKAFHEEMALGLRGKQSSLKMLPAYVGLPTGTERGTYIVLDMGGTNFRVAKILLDGKRGARIEALKRQKIPPKLRGGRREDLFDFLAHQVGLFLLDNHCQETSLAFIFSYPLEQRSLSSGVLIRWTKGFTIPGVEGEDVAFLLREALRREGLSHLQLKALLNDTVGTLLAASYSAPGFDMAVILGTGTNACYPESVTRLPFPPERLPAEKVIINLEWGNFNRLPMNEYDTLLDSQTPNPGEQRMEKMVSGLYLGELVRLILLNVARETEKTSYKKPYCLTSHHLATLAATTSQKTGPIKEISDLVFFRSARIAAAAIVAVVNWMDPDLQNSHAIAIDGALFTGYPGYREKMEETVRELLGEKAHLLSLHHEKEGSAIGAAVACALRELPAKSF